MNKIDFSNEGGFPLSPEDFEYLFETERGVYNSINKVLSGFSHMNFIISGCEIDGDNVSGGTIYLDGEILDIETFDISTNGTYLVKETVFDPEGIKSFEDGLTINVYKFDRAIPTTTDTGVNITELSKFIDIVGGGYRNHLLQVDSAANTEALTVKASLTAEVTPNRFKNVIVSMAVRAGNIFQTDALIQIAIWKNGSPLQSDIFNYQADKTYSYCQFVPTNVETGDIFEIRARKTTAENGALLDDINISFF